MGWGLIIWFGFDATILHQDISKHPIWDVFRQVWFFVLADWAFGAAFVSKALKIELNVKWLEILVESDPEELSNSLERKLRNFVFYWKQSADAQNSQTF